MGKQQVACQLLETARQHGENTGSPLQRNVAQLSRITKELQSTAMSLRMIPIKPTFQKMERLARDLARSCVKKVNFSTSGDETELDRTVVEEIAANIRDSQAVFAVDYRGLSVPQANELRTRLRGTVMSTK